MVLITGRQDIAANPNINISQGGPVRPSKAPATKETLLTLRTQLRTRLESGNGNGDSEMHAGTPAGLRSVRRLLDQVDRALARTDQGKHGICSDCSRPVEGHRMAMEPYATRCTSCQAVADWRGLNY